MQRLSAIVVHGSYSEVYRTEFNLLLERVRARVEHPVCGIYLECTEITMDVAIAQFLHPHLKQAAIQLQILPLFLLPGVHVCEDIPEAIAPLTTKYPNVDMEILEYFGKDNRLATLLEQQFEKHPQAKRILMAHGSRRHGANPEIEKLAQALNAQTAYWATEPSLQQTIALLTQTALEAVYVVPYFLFPGKIPAAIADQFSDLKAAYPRLEFYLGKPFGSQPDCAMAIANLLNPHQN